MACARRALQSASESEEETEQGTPTAVAIATTATAVVVSASASSTGGEIDPEIGVPVSKAKLPVECPTIFVETTGAPIKMSSSTDMLEVVEGQCSVKALDIWRSVESIWGITQRERYVLMIPDRDRHVFETRRSSQTGFFTFMFKYGFHLPLHPFFIVVFEYYGIASIQLTPNSWIILTTFFIFWRIQGWTSTVRAFRACYNIKKKVGMDYQYNFQGRQVRQGARVIKDLDSKVPHSLRQWFVIAKKDRTPWEFNCQWRRVRGGVNGRPDMSD